MFGSIPGVKREQGRNGKSGKGREGGGGVNLIYGDAIPQRNLHGIIVIISLLPDGSRCKQPSTAPALSPSPFPFSTEIDFSRLSSSFPWFKTHSPFLIFFVCVFLTKMIFFFNDKEENKPRLGRVSEEKLWRGNFRAGNKKGIRRCLGWFCTFTVTDVPKKGKNVLPFSCRARQVFPFFLAWTKVPEVKKDEI